MPLVASGADNSSEMEAVIEQSVGIALGALVGFVLADKDFYLLRN